MGDGVQMTDGGVAVCDSGVIVSSDTAPCFCAEGTPFDCTSDICDWLGICLFIYSLFGQTPPQSPDLDTIGCDSDLAWRGFFRRVAPCIWKIDDSGVYTAGVKIDDPASSVYFDGTVMWVELWVDDGGLGYLLYKGFAAPTLPLHFTKTDGSADVTSLDMVCITLQGQDDGEGGTEFIQDCTDCPEEITIRLQGVTTCSAPPEGDYVLRRADIFGGGGGGGPAACQWLWTDGTNTIVLQKIGAILQKYELLLNGRTTHIEEGCGDVNCPPSDPQHMRYIKKEFAAFDAFLNPPP